MIKKFNNKKPTIVYQHGLTGNHTVWKEHMNYMYKQKQSFITIDLLGHGNSQKVMGSQCYTVKNQGDYIWQVLKHEKIKNYVFVGQCLGGMIGLYNEAHRKTKAKALVLLGTPIRNPTNVFIHHKAEPFTWLFKLYFVYFLGGLGMIFGRRKYPLIDYSKYTYTKHFWIFLLDMIGTPKAAYGWTIDSMIKTDLTKDLKKIKKPVLLIYGGNDLEKPGMADTYATLKQNLKYTNTAILKKVDHLVTMRAPIQFSKEVLKFVKQIKNKCT